MNEEVRAAAERLRTLHRRYEDSDGGDDQPIAYFTACEQDEQDWPCDTIRVLDGLAADHEARAVERYRTALQEIEESARRWSAKCLSEGEANIHRMHATIAMHALAAATGASDGAGEATRLRERLRIATNALGAIADGGGPSWKMADDALTQMSVVDQSSGTSEAR
jgi:hypothetical protein